MKKTITHKQFITKLKAHKGTTILGIVAETPVQARRQGNPYREIKRRVHRHVICGANYQRAVERQGGEGFKSEGLPYGEFIVKNKVIKTDSGYQLRTVSRSLKVGKPISEKYFADGQEISPTVASQFIRPHYGSVKQAESGVTGKRQVRVRNYRFENIKEIHFEGETYELKE